MKVRDIVPRLADQHRRYSCGATCLANAIRLLGGDASETYVRKLSGTSPDGADEHDLRTAAHALGYDLQAKEAKDLHDYDDMRTWLIRWLDLGRPVLLCVDDFSHWVLAVGKIGSKIVVLDPAIEPPEPLGQTYGASRLDRWWWCDDGEDTPAYYGAAILPVSRTALTAAAKTQITEKMLEEMLARRDD